MPMCVIAAGRQAGRQCHQIKEKGREGGEREMENAINTRSSFVCTYTGDQKAESMSKRQKERSNAKAVKENYSVAL